jgi:D-amino-acid dehydrogenase
VRVVIAGAGVIGLWCARELAAIGVDVTVVGPRDQAAVSTPASAGWVVPALSHPLSSPGLLADTARQVLRREAAFSLQGMSPELARWLWRFFRAGTGGGYARGLRATLALATSCRREYSALRDEHPEIELRRDGLLLVARDDAALDEARHLVDAVADAGYDGKFDHLDPSGLTALEPALRDGLAGGVYARDELHVHPGSLVAALRADASRRGVEIVDGTVATVEPGPGAARTVVTSAGRLAADQVVIAAGCWSSRIAASLGARLPLQPAAGISITAAGPTPPSAPLKLVDANVAVTPFADGLRLAGRFTLGRQPRTASAGEVRRLVDAALPYLRGWRPSRVTSTHVGLRPATPDSLPLIGELPGRPGVLVAAGHGMLGLTLAPGTAAEVAHQVRTGAPSALGELFAVGRVGRGAAA